VVFLVAFFFIVLFSLGLDLDAAVPGFFIAAIRVPPLWVAAAERASELILLFQSPPRRGILKHYRNRLYRNQALRDKFRKKF
jgi:hypothetical protein